MGFCPLPGCLNKTQAFDTFQGELPVQALNHYSIIRYGHHLAWMSTSSRGMIHATSLPNPHDLALPIAKSHVGPNDLLYFFQEVLLPKDPGVNWLIIFKSSAHDLRGNYQVAGSGFPELKKQGQRCGDMLAECFIKLVITLVSDREGDLRDHWSGIHPFRHLMNSNATFLCPGANRPKMRVRTRKMWKKGGMNVEKAFFLYI